MKPITPRKWRRLLRWLSWAARFDPEPYQHSPALTSTLPPSDGRGYPEYRADLIRLTKQEQP